MSRPKLLPPIKQVCASALLVAACSAGGATAPGTATPQSTPQLAPTGAASATPSPTIGPGTAFDRELWSELFPGQPDAITYSSLADIAANSDLVVAGRAARIDRGPDVKDGGGTVTYWATVTFAVDEVLGGELRTRTPDTVAVWTLLGVGGNGAGTDFADRYANALASIPQERTVLFLLNLQEWAIKFGRPTDAPDADPMGYMQNGGQSWFRDVDDRVVLPSEEVGDWPRAYAGTPFDAFVAEVRSKHAGP